VIFAGCAEVSRCYYQGVVSLEASGEALDDILKK
jgi:hypothetical protein